MPEPVSPLPSVTPSYRLLAVGELTRAGDEWWDSKNECWREIVACVVTVVRTEVPRRRLIASYEDPIRQA